MARIITSVIWATFCIPSIIAVPATRYETKATDVEGYMNNAPIELDGKDIKIFFYNNDNPSEDIQVDITNGATVGKTTFSREKQTFFVIHGWLDCVTSEICTSVKDAYLEHQDVNVFVVDWGSYSKMPYADAMLHVEPIGKLLATMIRALQKNNGLDLGKTAIVGHSLGAHIAGVAGTALGGELDYIVGMDPAGPYFFLSITSNRLTPTSAKFVQVIHTCGAILGFFKPIGVADYYPNGGKKQKGCGVDLTGNCSHGRSFAYFAESIVSGKFEAQACDSYEEYEAGKCNGGKSLMGGFNIDKSARGSYYLHTNDNAPYAKA